MPWGMRETDYLRKLFEHFRFIHDEVEYHPGVLVTLAITKQDLLKLIEHPRFFRYAEIMIPDVHGRLLVMDEQKELHKKYDSDIYDFRGKIK